jgi:hypothetical protein
MNKLKALLANKYLQSWLATAFLYLAFDAQDILIKIANGDWTWPIIQGLIFIAFRSLVKALIVLVFPTLPINPPQK